jgi:hypothetical protein
LMSIPKTDLKCPTCSKTPNREKIANMINDAMALRDNRPFNAEDPVVLSEGEVYCSAECYVIAVIREEEQ